MDPTTPDPTLEPAGELVPLRAYRGRDRRRRATPRFSRHTFFGGRRKAPRRDGEREGSFVDLYSTRLLLMVMWVALMNVADSFFTLIHLQHGGSEANPIAGVLLLTGRVSFVFWKSSLIAVALLVLCVHKNFSIPRVGPIAGSAVTEGVVKRAAHVRVLRDRKVIHTGKVGSLKRLKDDVREVAAPLECGIGIDGFADVKAGDQLEVFELEEIRPSLE